MTRFGRWATSGVAASSLLVGVGGLNSASAAVLFEDDFESYSDTAAMHAVWGVTTTSTLDTTGGFGGGQAMAHNGGANNIINFTAFSPSESEGLRITGKIFDDASGNKRFSIGTRTGTTFPLFEMGMYNAPGANGYAARVTTFPGNVSPDWFDMSPVTAPTQGWHTYAVEFTLDQVLITLDLGSDGSIDLSNTIALPGQAYADSFNQLRLGGPSGLSSTSGGLFDDLRVETFVIPEPASLALLGIGGAAILGRRRDRS